MRETADTMTWPYKEAVVGQQRRAGWCWLFVSGYTYAHSLARKIHTQCLDRVDEQESAGRAVWVHVAQDLHQVGHTPRGRSGRPQTVRSEVALHNKTEHFDRIGGRSRRC